MLEKHLKNIYSHVNITKEDYENYILNIVENNKELNIQFVKNYLQLFNLLENNHKIIELDNPKQLGIMHNLYFAHIYTNKNFDNFISKFEKKENFKLEEEVFEFYQKYKIKKFESTKKIGINLHNQLNLFNYSHMSNHILSNQLLELLLKLKKYYKNKKIEIFEIEQKLLDFLLDNLKNVNLEQIIIFNITTERDLAFEFYTNLDVESFDYNLEFRPLNYSYIFYSKKFKEINYIKTNTRNAFLLHNYKGPSVVYEDNFHISETGEIVFENKDLKFYHIENLPIPEKWFTNLTVEEINNLTNMELKRIALQIYGLKNFLIDSKAKKVSEDEFGEFYIIENFSNRGHLGFIAVINSTAEQFQEMGLEQRMEFRETELSQRGKWFKKYLIPVHPKWTLHKNTDKNGNFVYAKPVEIISELAKKSENDYKTKLKFES